MAEEKQPKTKTTFEWDKRQQKLIRTDKMNEEKLGDGNMQQTTVTIYTREAALHWFNVIEKQLENAAKFADSCKELKEKYEKMSESDTKKAIVEVLHVMSWENPQARINKQSYEQNMDFIREATEQLDQLKKILPRDGA